MQPPMPPPLHPHQPPPPPHSPSLPSRPLRIFSDPTAQRLSLRVLDADVGKADDLLGSAMRGLQVCLGVGGVGGVGVG